MGIEERVRAGGVGERLRAHREAAGVSLDEIASRTRVPMRHLVAIEEGRVAELPAAPYSAGFVKAYAQTLGIDGGALSREIFDEIDRLWAERARLKYQPYEPGDASRVPALPLAIGAAVLLLLLAIGFAVWHARAPSGGGADATAASVGADPIAATPPNAIPLLAAPASATGAKSGMFSMKRAAAHPRRAGAPHARAVVRHRRHARHEPARVAVPPETMPPLPVDGVVPAVTPPESIAPGNGA